MKKKLNVRAFNGSWINCATNEKLSLLVSIDESYEKAALINSYHFFIEETDNGTRRLNLFHNDEFHIALDRFDYEDFTVSDTDITGDLKSKLDSGNIIQIYADLYEWIENSFDYHKRHSLNYVVLIGYDDEKQCFYSICDNLDGYMENEVPYENVERSILSDADNMHQIIRYSDDIPHYKLDTDSVVDSAQRIIESIDELLGKKFWSTDDYKENQFFIYILTKIAEREKGNKQLMEYLSEIEFISFDDAERLGTEFEELYKKWNMLKGVFIKAFLRKRLPDVERIQDGANALLSQEHKLWSDFLDLPKG